MAKILHTDGSEEPLLKPCLASLQKAVGGSIQIVPTHNGKLLVINEDGKNVGLPFNLNATNLYPYSLHDPIVGDAVLCEKDEIQ